MANHHGNEGTVKIGANVVAEVQSFELNEEDEPLDNSAMGDTWETHVSGSPKRWSGSLTCWWDETDTNGQMSLRAGTSVTVNLYPEGDGSGDTYYTGTATVVGVPVQSSLRSMVQAQFNFRGNGALTRTTV